MTKFRFRRTETRPSFPGMGTVDGTVYAVFSFYNDIPVGWVAKAGKEWLAWNTHGDLWTSYGPSRDTAAEDMLRAGWKAFVRNPGKAA